jgi:hypothetical protein
VACRTAQAAGTVPPWGRVAALALGAGRCERRPGGAPTRARKTQPGVSAAARARRPGDDCPDRGARRRAPRSDRDARADVKPGRRIQALVGTAPRQMRVSQLCSQDLGSRDGCDIREAPRAPAYVAPPAADVKRDERLYVPQGAAVPKRRSRCLTSSPRPRSKLMMSGQSPDICEPDSPHGRHPRQALRCCRDAPSRWTARWTVRWTVLSASERFLAVRSGRQPDDRIRRIPNNHGSFLQIV